MADKLKQLREPAAWLTLGAMALHLLWMLITFVWYAVRDGRFALGNAGWVIVTQQSGVIVLATGIAVAACALWQQPSANARLLALLASIGFAAVAGLGVIFALIGAVGGAAWLVVLRAGFLEAVVPVLAGLVTFQIHRGLPPPVRTGALPGSGMAGPPPQWGRQQPPDGGPQQAPYPPAQSWGPPPVEQGGGWQNPPGNVRSRSDQFGNEFRNSADNFQPFSETPPQTEWHPAAQPPPQRLEPSPDQPPIGPHSSRPGQPDTGQGAEPNPDRYSNHDEDRERRYPE